MKKEKKVWPEYFQRIFDGEKKYELRLADWECSPGDLLLLKEWDPKTKSYTGREIEKVVTHVLKTNDVKFWPKADVEKHGFLVISFD
ncbi:MAG: DUF3850 domain-containing protein [Candidatus Andersenbacteria bacterium]|nr:DUF3850 domain-containing protein [Candidatus Andersenbacteria bacterium]MBI3250490.1 DUF3850 domain-containing protein [Candidatus Andersenbacteria bacterium]